MPPTLCNLERSEKFIQGVSRVRSKYQRARKILDISGRVLFYARYLDDLFNPETEEGQSRLQRVEFLYGEEDYDGLKDLVNELKPIYQMRVITSRATLRKREHGAL